MSRPLNKQPLHKHEGPQWKIIGDIRGQLPKAFLFPPNFVVLKTICFKHMIKTKSSPLKMYFAPPNLKIWLRAWFCQNCVCN